METVDNLQAVEDTRKRMIMDRVRALPAIAHS